MPRAKCDIVANINVAIVWGGRVGRRYVLYFTAASRGVECAEGMEG